MIDCNPQITQPYDKVQETNLIVFQSFIFPPPKKKGEHSRLLQSHQIPKYPNHSHSQIPHRKHPKTKESPEIPVEIRNPLGNNDAQCFFHVFIYICCKSVATLGFPRKHHGLKKYILRENNTLVGSYNSLPLLSSEAP